MPQTLRDFALVHSDVLIERAREGDQRAFGKLVGLWFKRIYNYSYKYFNDHDLAMEATQKTFISVHYNIKKLNEISSFKYWLYKIASNQCNEENRRQQKLQTTYVNKYDEAEEIADYQFHPAKELDTNEANDKVGILLSHLPEEQRQVLIMKEFEELKFREIAEILQVSENTVKSRLYYGLKALRKVMKEKNRNYDN